MSFESEFELVPLGQVASFINGDRSTNYPKGEDYVDNGIPFISAADLSDGCVQQSGVKRISTAAYERLRNGKIQDRDVLFCLRGSIGKLAYVHPNEAGAIASSLVIVRANAKIDSRYLYFILRSQAGQQAAASLNNGSAQPNLSVSELQKVAVPLPPMPIQRQIAATLDSFDDRITLLRETNATLEAIAQALFKSWFVDFDPVRAKMEGRTPEGMDEATAALFPDGVEASELGEVPRGWRVATLDSVCSYLNRGLSPKYLETGGVLVLNQKCIRDFSVDYGKGRRHDPSQRKIDGREVAVGDVLVNSTGVGTLGRVAQVLQLPEAAIVDSHVTVVRAGPALSWPYLGQFMARKQPEIEAMGEGSTGQTELSRAKLAGMSILVPSAATLNAFEGVVIPLKRRIAINESKSKTLATLRDTLLPRLISGQLRLSEAIEMAQA